jgi:guanylate kinase
VPKEGKLFVISGPSGVGKDTLVNLVLKNLSDSERVVTATTRQPRPGEREGISYRFLTAEEFDQGIRDGQFLEWAWVHGNRYGTPAPEVRKRLEQGISLLLAVDIQGAKSIRDKMGEAVTIFIAPPSFKELEERLRGRSTEQDAEIATRIKTAETEMDQMDQYDFAIVNTQVDQAAKELQQIIEAHS